MAQPYSLKATKRTMTGKRVRRLRTEGLIPAVIYGTVVDEPISITVEERELQRTYQAIGSFTLLDLDLEGEVYTVYIRNLQSNPIKRRPVHAEFFAPNLRVAMTANVPLHLVGEIGNDALIVTQARESVELRGLPTALPGVLEVDVSTLESLEDAIYVKDLNVGDDVEVLTDGEELIARLTEPQLVVEEDEAAAEGEEEEAAEAADEAPAEEAEDSGEDD
jgi:large subunit ribosomal protein L25